MTDRTCPHCATSKWNPVKGIYDNIGRLYCGIASSYDGRVEALDECWLKMSRSQRTRWKKLKKEEHELIRRIRV
jgi:hypothetical protein